jgi:hypothetical protein
MVITRIDSYAPEYREALSIIHDYSFADIFREALDTAAQYPSE